MKALASALLAAGAVTALLSSPPAPDVAREIANVVAFARLYGVARYFYPSDAAAELDWNRFAVVGIARVRAARDAEELRAALETLVGPLGPGLHIGPSLPATGPTKDPDKVLVAWRYLGAGFGEGGGYGPYGGKRTHRAPPTGGTEGFVTLMQSLPGGPLRGRTVRLRAQVRATPADPSGAAALWLRVDRAGGPMGFFDNMGDRPIREPDWSEYSIQGTVADDAAAVAFGVMALGAVTADFDAVELAVKRDEGGWQPLAIEDAGFESATEGSPHGAWYLTGPRRAAVSRPAEGAPEGRRYCRFAPPPPGDPDVELFAEPAPLPGAHVDVDLGSGLRARVPLVLTDAEARTAPARESRLDDLKVALAAWPEPTGEPDPDTRMADVVVAWNVFRHFYPYWAETGVDWDARLRPRLEAARSAESRTAQLDVLRGLAADARDGHAGVRDPLEKEERAELPVRLRVIDGRLVVVASAVPAEAPVGSVVSTIEGEPVGDWLARAMSLASGTTQWRQVRALWELTSGPKDGTVRLGLEDGAGPREITLRYDAAEAPPETRPDPVTELEPGIWYVDLTRATMAQITPQIETLAAARGVVFDVRGYPTDSGAGVLPHLLAGPESDRWMHVAKVVGPFGQWAGWESLGWDMKPQGPRIGGSVVFLTDERAISYAESVMGYVADRRLGTIVGATTAGTNGNVATFTTPGGFAMHFTGMRVTGHDGTAPLHLVGVRPDVRVVPTVEGVRAGRDEVLERGVAVVRAAASAQANGGTSRFPEELVDWVAHEANPLLTGTGEDTWDRQIRERGYILRDGGTFWLWYTGYNPDRGGDMALGLATSPDGLTWTRHPANPLFDRLWTEDMCVVKHEGVYYMFAEGRHDIAHLLTSTDGLRWEAQGSLDVRTRSGEPLSPGPYGTPTVWIEDGTWHLFYERGDLGIWLATSKDRKVWRNVQDEPVIALGPGAYDRHAVALNQVVRYRGRYYGVYHANEDPEWKGPWTTCLAVSDDLVRWEKYPGNPVIRSDDSSGILVDDGETLRLYTMHPEVRLWLPRRRP